MSSTTTNMALVIPSVLTDLGPTYATLINAAFTAVDAHDHSTGNGVKVTPGGLNISSDLTFAQNNATNLRTARLYNNTSFTPGVNDLTCLYALNDELYYRDGGGNIVQVTTSGSLNIGTVSSLSINDSQFTLKYFGDITKKIQFSAAAITSGVTRVFALPEPGANDTLMSLTSSSLATNKSFSNASTLFVDASDNTKSVGFQSSGATTASKLTLASVVTSSRTITFPDVTDTLAVRGSTQTFTAAQSFTATINMNAANVITFFNAGSTFSTSLGAGANIANYAAKLPIADGTAGQVLKTDGSGQWGWASASAFSRGDVATSATITALSSSSSFTRLTGSTATALQGITAGAAGAVLIVYNVSTANISIAHQNAGASAANRIITPSALTVTLLPQWSAHFAYDDSQSRWILTAVTSSQEWTAYTPTISAGFGTATSISGFYKIVGDSVFVKVRFTAGTVAASNASFSLPTGVTMSSTKMPSGAVCIGNVACSQNSASQFLPVVAPGTSATDVFITIQNASNSGLTIATGSTISANSVVWTIACEVAIS